MKLKALQLLGRGLKNLGRGSSLVGYLDEKLGLNVLSEIDLTGVTVVFVTGTNGKTSIVNGINELYRKSGKKVLSNLEGANLISGIKTAIIMNSKAGELDADVLLLEVDEKTVAGLAEIIPPNHILLSNFFRDQLDRYFEISLIIEEIMEVIKEYKPTVYYNSQDPLLYDYLKDIDTKQVAYKLERDELSYENNTNIVEVKYCPVCTEKLEYRYYHYSHIGEFYCDNCGFRPPTAEYNIAFNESAKELQVRNDRIKEEYTINLGQKEFPKYLLINFALIITYMSDKIPNDNIKRYLPEITLPKGRNNLYSYAGGQIYLNLAKNVVGMEQTIKYLVENNDEINLVVAFNDNYADGRDVSWIWDVNFETLISKLNELHVIGSRKEEIQLRFLYEGFDNIWLYDDFDVGLEKAFSGKNFAIMTNYTPLSKINRFITKKITNNIDN